MTTNSTESKFSRYVGGGNTEVSKSRIEWWDRIVFDSDPSDIVYVVERHYENRLDLISTLFYGESRWWWVIAQFNNILNPVDEIVEGRVLTIPNKSRLQTMLLTKRGGIKSTRTVNSNMNSIIL